MISSIRQSFPESTNLVLNLKIQTRLLQVLNWNRELENLAAELLPGSLSEKRAGCSIRLFFSFKHQQNIIDYEKIEKVLLEIWGTNRKITQTVSILSITKEEYKECGND